MLQASLLIPVSGRVKCSVSVAPFVATLGGCPVGSGGQLTVAAGLGAPTQYDSGMGYAQATGAVFGVRINPNIPAIATVHQGLPFSSDGSLACDTVNAITYHLAGIPHVATGHIAIDPDTT